MNCTNALGFLGIGFAFAVAPFAAPGLFPHTAIDGSSARALWVEVMGAAQMLLGSGYLVRRWFAGAVSAVEPAVSAAAGERVLAIAELADALSMPERPVATVAEADTVTLRGEHADVWRAFAQAMRTNGDARQLARRLVEIARVPSNSEARADNLVAFPSADEDRETGAVA